MGRPKKFKKETKEEPEESEQEIVPDSIEESEEEPMEEPQESIEESAQEPQEQACFFEVYNKRGEFVRTYSLENHGQEAQSLAKQFASKISGAVISVKVTKS